jgi:Zn-dependent peptidase ImmA (M78 family)/DNA-binding XRE family transcriptional regulator
MAEFNYTRLEVARKRRGLTKTKLAEAAGISTRMLTKYEREGHLPSQTTVARFTQSLGFPMAFFFGDTLEEPSPEGSSFRALSSATARQRDQALSSGTLAIRLGAWIENRFALPEPDVPIYQDLDPETAAEAVRDAWGLGQRPIRNVIHLLEAHGVRVFSLAEECKKVDGFSVWQGEIPFVFLNTTKTAERSRMDAAHELGHLVLHAHGGPRGREAEDQAHAFGSALLMPAATVLAEVPHGASLKQIVKAKKRWKVAAVNLARRSYKLGLITEWQYRSICIELTKRGKANEPQPMQSRETSQVLDKVFRALKAEGMSKADVARELAIPVDELNKSIFGLLKLAAVESGPEDNTAPVAEIEPPILREPPRRPALKIVS